MGRPANSVERVLSLHVQQTGSCWEWTGGKTSKGYGKTALLKKTLLAHRFVYEALVGPIEEGKQLDHLCRNRACVNPEHLQPVSQKENMLRGYSPSANNSRKVQCIRGHELQGENVYLTPDNRRQCKVCRKNWGKAYASSSSV